MQMLGNPEYDWMIKTEPQVCAPYSVWQYPGLTITRRPTTMLFITCHVEKYLEAQVALTT
jgi:hypothetical protein